MVINRDFRVSKAFMKGETPVLFRPNNCSMSNDCAWLWTLFLGGGRGVGVGGRWQIKNRVFP